MSLSASVIGASGFTGGAVAALLADHPDFEIIQATSRSYTGRSIGTLHPNLRDIDLRFTDPTELATVDVLFAATPHGVAMERIDAFREVADLVVDLSADFRLTDPGAYDRFYDGHERPDLLGESTYGLVELTRDDLADASLIACGGCNATVTLLALAPLFDADLVSGSDEIVVDVKVGSSEGGASGGQAASHPERSGIVRPYAPTGHRHEAEIEQFLDRGVNFTVHAVDMIRGAAATSHLLLDDLPSKGTVWSALRSAYEDEAFVQFVAGGSGVYRYPEPKVVAGTNDVEIGFEFDERNDRLVVLSAIDNMMKGSAGQAIHAANVALGLEETAGLKQRGLHPVGAP